MAMLLVGLGRHVEQHAGKPLDADEDDRLTPAAHAVPAV